MKTNIPPHITKTLTEVDAEIKVRQGEIAQLIGIRTGLCELYEVPAEMPIGNLTAPKRGRKPRQPMAEIAPEESAAKTPPPTPAKAGLNLPAIPQQPKTENK